MDIMLQESELSTDSDDLLSTTWKPLETNRSLVEKGVNASGGRITQLQTTITIGVIYYTILILGGTLGNIMAISAMQTKKGMSTHSRHLFSLLAASDIAVLLINPVRYWCIFLLKLDIRTIHVIFSEPHCFLS